MTAAELPQMAYATKAILQAHPNNRIRAVSRYVLKTWHLCVTAEKMLKLIDDPSYIVDGPEAQQALDQIFHKLNAEFFLEFGENLPK